MMTGFGGDAALWQCAELYQTPASEQIMSMPALSRRWTAADVRELIQEDRPWPRYELLDGELLVTPAPIKHHQFAVGRLHLLIGNYCEQHGIGVALMSPSDIELVTETIMQPDVFVVAEELLAEPVSKEWSDITWLMLAVEVLSPSTQRMDRVHKRDFYLANGVREYWIVDLDGRVFERWTPDAARPTLHREWIEWHPAGASGPLRIDVADFFLRGARLPRIV